MDEAEPNRRAPSRAWYFVALAAMAVGPVGLGWLRWSSARVVGAESRTFVAPGAITFRTDGPGARSLYHEIGAAFEGRSLDAPAGIPEEITITLIDLTRGVEVAVEPSLGRRVRAGGHEREEIARFDVAFAGPHRLEVGGDIPEMVCSVGPTDSAAPIGAPDWLATAASPASAWRGAAGIAVYALTLAGGAAGVGIVVVTFVMRRRNRA